MFAISQISTRDRIYKKLLDFVRNQFKLKDYYDKEGGWTRETVQIIWKTTKKYDWINNILDEIERSNNKNKITNQTNKCSRKERTSNMWKAYSEIFNEDTNDMEHQKVYNIAIHK